MKNATGMLAAATRVAAPAAPYAAVGVATAYALARFRLLPAALCRAWFVASAPAWLVAARVTSELLNLVGKVCGVAPNKRQGWTTWALNCCLAGWLRCNPQLRVVMDAASKRCWAAVPTAPAAGETKPRAAVVLMNHTSFADAIVIGFHATWAFRANVKVVYKSSLVKVPIFGPQFPLGGHFPVFFKSAQDGNFSVDDRQAAVSAAMAKYLADDGGRLMLFPEGAVNKTPATLQPFRHGTFKLLCDSQCDVYLMTMTGVHDFWPAAATVGGFPATVRISFRKFETRYGAEDAAAMAARARTEMQAELDTLRAQ